MRISKSLIFVSLLLMFTSCEFIGNLIHDDQLVAKLGKNKLYLSQLEAYIPSGLSPEDSTNLAMQYINTWATELLYMDIAGQQLTKEEMDVSKELEDYRHSLLKYKYEQRFINERLDTLVSDSQIKKYYDTHKELLTLDVPIVKARFLDIMQESPNLEIIKSRMSSNSYQDLAEADSLAYSSALRYEDLSDKWVDAVTFAKNFGLDYASVLAKWDRKTGFVEIKDERGDARIGYICDYQGAGTLAPLDYCSNRIKDIILSSRKQELLSNLDKDLVQNALDKRNLVIY